MRAHAVDTWPAPSCGAVLGSANAPRYARMQDFAVSSREDFRLDEPAVRRLQEREGTLLGLVISHPSPVRGAEAPDPLLFTPSAAEMVAQAKLGAPFGVLVSTRSLAYKPWWFGDQCPIRAVIGRIFRHGVTDCYSLVRDWFRVERGITIPDFPRDWEWWLGGKDLYMEGFYRAGGRSIPIKEAAPGDVILCRVRSKVSNHAVVLLPQGLVAHHLGSSVPYDPRAMSTVQRPGKWLHKLCTHALRWRGDLNPAG